MGTESRQKSLQINLVLEAATLHEGILRVSHCTETCKQRNGTSIEVTNKFRRKGYTFLPRSSTTCLLARGQPLRMEECLPHPGQRAASCDRVSTRSHLHAVLKVTEESFWRRTPRAHLRNLFLPMAVLWAGLEGFFPCLCFSA